MDYFVMGYDYDERTLRLQEAAAAASAAQHADLAQGAQETPRDYANRLFTERDTALQAASSWHGQQQRTANPYARAEVAAHTDAANDRTGRIHSILAGIGLISGFGARTDKAKSLGVTDPREARRDANRSNP